MYAYGYTRPILDRKVAIYARVSTEHEAQLSALGNQLDWYNTILAQHPEWTLVKEPYVDEGLTGTSAKKRPMFLQMIEDAKKHEFDLILTREVSRFARNTVDTLQYTRQLRTLGVEVYFINDNIRTFDGDGELRLTIMATLAQDESRKTSIRVKAGQQTSMENGVYYGNGNILGYDRQGKGYKINPEQARTVRKIFDMYLDGEGLRKIQFALESGGYLTATGRSNWHQSNIAKILKNPFYCGVMVYHKQWTPDFLEQKKINNIGDIPMTEVKGTHEPIVTEEEFWKVQQIIQSHHRKDPDAKPGSRIFGKKPPSDIWVKLLECECGHRFNRKRWRTTDTGTQYGYQCYAQIRSGSVKTRENKGLSTENICSVPMIPGWKLQMMANHIFKSYLKDTEQVLALAQSMLEDHIADDAIPEADHTEELQRYRAEVDKLSKRLDNLVEMRADGDISRELFKTKKADIEKQIAELTTQIDQLSPKQKDTPEEDVSYEQKLTVLRYALEQYVDFDSEENIPESVIDAFVIKIIVKKDGFEWYLRFSPENDPLKCTITGSKRKGDTPPSFALCCSGCYQKSSQVMVEALPQTPPSGGKLS